MNGIHGIICAVENFEFLNRINLPPASFTPILVDTRMKAPQAKLAASAEAWREMREELAAFVLGKANEPG